MPVLAGEPMSTLILKRLPTAARASVMTTTTCSLTAWWSAAS